MLEAKADIVTPQARQQFQNGAVLVDNWSEIFRKARETGHLDRD